jgi:hypothetical protein
MYYVRAQVQRHYPLGQEALHCCWPSIRLVYRCQIEHGLITDKLIEANWWLEKKIAHDLSMFSPLSHGGTFSLVIQKIWTRKLLSCYLLPSLFTRHVRGFMHIGAFKL